MGSVHLWGGSHQASDPVVQAGGNEVPGPFRHQVRAVSEVNE